MSVAGLTTACLDLSNERERTAVCDWLAGRPEATPFHAPGWSDAVQAAYDATPVYLGARRGGALAGVAAFAACRAGLTGRALVTLPFAGAQPGLIAEDAETAAALAEAALIEGRRRGLSFVEIRETAPADAGVRLVQAGWRRSAAYVHFRLPLDPDPQTVWRTRVDRRVRTKVRAAEKRGLRTEWGGAERLPDFLTVYRQTMRRLGSPVHAPVFFKAIFDSMGARARILTVRDGDAPAAAALVLADDRWIGFPFAASSTAHLAKHPNNLLYWRLIEHACEAGLPALDLGRSPAGGGTAHFKRQWGAEEQALAYFSRACAPGAEAPAPADANSPTLRRAAALWRRLPEGLTRRAGPSLAARLP